MKSFLQKILFLSVLFAFSFTLYAQNNAEVCQWTKQTLLNTLSIDYTYQKGDDDQIRKSYTDNAWDAISGFLGGYVDTVKEQHLTTHPIFIQEPSVVASGVDSGIYYWRVNEEVLIPELHLIIAFSMLVIKTNSSTSGGYVIQSLNMVKRESP